MTELPNLLVCVVGGVRTGTNAMGRIVHELGFPCQKRALKQVDKMLPSGNFSEELVGPTRKPPYIFKTHGFARPRDLKKFVARTDTALIRMTRDVQESLESMEQCARWANAGEIKYWPPRRGVRVRETQGRRVHKHLRRVRGLVKAFKGPKITVRFDEMLANPDDVVHKVAKFLGVPVTESALKVVSPEISRFSRKS
jgi:hypothetical protein